MGDEAKRPLISCKAALVLVLAGFCLLAMFQGSRQRAEKAEQSLAAGKAAFAAGRWAEAYRSLEEAQKNGATDGAIPGMINDAKAKHRDELVAQADQAADPDQALALLEQAQGVSPAPSIEPKLTAAKYAVGKKAFEAQQWQRAYDLLNAVRAHQDAGTLADQAKGRMEEAAYKDAVTAQGKGDLDQALALFRRAGTHQDAQTKAAEVAAAIEKREAEKRAAAEREAAAKREAEIAARRLNMSYTELDGLFGIESSWTDVKKDAEWKNYEGKIVRWRGEVVEVDKTLGITTLQVKHLPHTFTFDVQVFLARDQIERAANLSKGSLVTYEGELDDRPGALAPCTVKNGVIVAE